MKRLTEREEIAQALNFGKYPVLKIDLSECDEYGLKGSVCRVDQGEFRDGSKYYKRSELRVYSDERKLAFGSHGCCLSAQLSYIDLMEYIETAMSPIVKPDSEFVVVIYDSKVREVYAVIVASTGKASRHSTKPLSVEEVDLTNYILMAEARYQRFSKLQ